MLEAKFGSDPFASMSSKKMSLDFALKFFLKGDDN